MHIGNYHIIAHYIAESASCLHSVIEHVQHHINIQAANFISLPPMNLPLTRFTSIRRIPLKEAASCALYCHLCERLSENRCPGCPASTGYKKSQSVLRLGLVTQRTP
jgi:hypothetical protein